MIDSFVPTELAVAPNPLGLASHLKLTTIPIDSQTCFELWMPTADSMLLPEEAMLLVGDRPRLEEICAQLTWLLSGTLHASGNPMHSQRLYDWQAVQDSIQQSGLQVDALGVTHTPEAICSQEDGQSAAWSLYPTSWTVLFLGLKPIGNSYRVEIHPIRLTIATGESVTKPMRGIAIGSTYL